MGDNKNWKRWKMYELSVSQFKEVAQALLSLPVNLSVYKNTDWVEGTTQTKTDLHKKQKRTKKLCD